MSAWPFGSLTPRRYRLLLVDPPWNFTTYSEAGQGKSPSQHYDCMTLDDLMALPVKRLAFDDCGLVLWSIWSHLDQSIRLMEAWGFKFITGGAWAKQTKDGRGWDFSTGYYWRGACEPYLFGKIGKPKVCDRSIRNLIASPTREHSRKPDEMHANLERMFPGPRAELFARQRREGWDCWGLEVDKFEGAADGP